MTDIYAFRGRGAWGGLEGLQVVDAVDAADGTTCGIAVEKKGVITKRRMSSPQHSYPLMNTACS